ncbi:hypothetical protein [Foetidibacter luteolus]|uniref:hypothetical protein n=1 Tax=Foetidibacter luteolus TaxID=2608880 RepID=UPI00129B6C09|nr:hypothetical protein [Foetidibacter luteolus]
MRTLLTATFFLSQITAAVSQSAATEKSEIPLMRQIYHQNIDKSQQEIFSLDGTKDDMFKPSADEEINLQINHAATIEIDKLQDLLESDSTFDNNEKIKYLRSLRDLLAAFASDFKSRRLKGALFIDVVEAFKESMQLQRNNESLLPVIKKNQMETGEILMKCFAFKENVGAADCKDELLLKYCDRHPDRILVTLSNNQQVPFRDSLIIKTAYTQQENLYNFAAAPNSFASKIAGVDEPLVRIISKMARMKTGRQYFPFLDNLYKGKVTFEEIDAVMEDDEKYYSLLVKTELDYASRLVKRDTPMAMQTLTNKLAIKGKEVYINEINGLHELPDNVRFKKIDKLSPQELYYLAVLGEEEIYTSSYVRGVYPRLWKAKLKKGDSLLMSVSFDHFKKFIKVAANYNTLDDFLGKMEQENAELLMKAFVNRLDKKTGVDSLEDAVDVANSFASIYDNKLKSLILNQVGYNLQQAKQTHNLKAERIYSILNTIFLSNEPDSKIDLTASLGIPPVYTMPNKLMKDTAGRIIIQQFFYGDKDGKNVFNAFLGHVSNGNWKIINNPQWVEVRSLKGTPVTIFSNRALDEEKGLDEEAQTAMRTYMSDHDLQPSMIIHRGHSYYLNTTLKYLQPSARVILLGSCGGYQSLSTVLNTCPSAQIISSKQTGSGLINGPMIDVIIETLRSSKDLNWPVMWKGLEQRLNNPLFADYVPPYKNLGAVFIMAYKKLEEREAEMEN